MNVLLVYPKYPDTYWGFKHALKFISKKAAVPPLGLITVSAMLPNGWNKKLVDLNIENLNDKDLDWADYVFISSMYVQKESVDLVLDRCTRHKVKIVAGGPLFTQEYQNYPQVHHFILNEAEITLPPFLRDLETGRQPDRIYQTDSYADMHQSPVPDYQLLNLKAYALMNVQVSRGCPYACDFCEITALLGRKVRMKSTRQLLDELEVLYNLNWRGTVAVVDDNFIGRKSVIKNELLPGLIDWMKAHKYPFQFSAQSSIELADDELLLERIRQAGFVSAFIGIETPDELALQQCHKVQNENRDLIQNVKKIQNAGLQVSGGFIVGFDSDTPSIFQRQIDFIQNSGIVSAMVGLLNAPKNTNLYRQMEKEDRLTIEATGSNTDFTMNFKPKMNNLVLMEGYHRIIRNIYSEKPYYKRIRVFFRNYKPAKKVKVKLDITRIMAFFRSVIIIGIFNKGRGEYWKFLLWTLFRKPELFTDAVVFTVYGYHYRTIYGLRKAGN
ncbi:MAG: B12-binding domain-containing radical SAM protein [Bacteroidota bacterium]|nr:MAG: B12-binding domain-containing radical SAM protein [Bacteroidota bacterium]